MKGNEEGRGKDSNEGSIFLDGDVENCWGMSIRLEVLVVVKWVVRN